MRNEEINLDNSRDKKFRGLEIYDRLRRGERLVKEDLANEYGVSLKTIQRDIDELRDYLFEKKDINWFFPLLKIMISFLIFKNQY